MAQPLAVNLAYRGINTGNAQCIAYRGYICGIILQSWRDTLRLSVTIVRRVRNYVQL